MKDIYINYNPFTLTTEVKINDQPVPGNSWFNGLSNKRLQEWMDDLPKKLKNETNDTAFRIWFQGTPLDYEDLQGTLESSNAGITVEHLEFLPPKNLDEGQRQARIEEVFNKILSPACPFPDIQTEELKTAFKNARNSNFDVFVVATMSAGKSTLINSLLGQKLMPSRQEACTAIITRIQDDDNMAGQPFQAYVYKKGQSEPDFVANLSLDEMDRLNCDDKVEMINATGQIPFVDSSRISLVLVDTPGPNNARNESHRAVQQRFLNNNAKPLVLYIMTGEFGNDSDNALLEAVAESMRGGGKTRKGELRDRFLFVVNKLDGRKKEDGKIQDFMLNVKNYLEAKGIDDPQLFPAAALPAMDIKRMLKNPDELDDDELEEVEQTIRKLNRRIHLEKEASLPKAIKREIDDQLKTCRKVWSKGNNDPLNDPEEALIHTGIRSIEAAIRQYVEKYAYTAKIKNLVDTFQRSLDAAQAESKIQQAMMQSKEEEKNIKADIERVQKELEEGREARDWESEIDDRVAKIRVKTSSSIETTMAEINSRITDKQNSGRGVNIEKDELSSQVRDFSLFAKRLEESFRIRLEDLVEKELVEYSDKMVQDYASRLEKFNLQVTGVNISADSLIYEKFTPAGLTTDAINSIQISEQREDGQEWVKNTSKKWWKPWTWGQEAGYYRTKYKTVQVIPLNDLVQLYFAPVEAALLDNMNKAQDFIDESARKISSHFQEVFGKLDEQLDAKLESLKHFEIDGKNIEAERARAQAKLDWLNGIKAEVAEILVI